MLEWFIINKELMKLAYAFLVVVICVIIVKKTDKLFKLSHHQGIRYFRNAFFFYGIAFFIRYFLGTLTTNRFVLSPLLAISVKVLFEFFLIMAGFFLLYSLIWKKIEKEESFSSLLNPRIALFYSMSILFVILDFIWQSYAILFISQIIVFFIAIIVSFKNYQEKGNKHKFLKFYFLAMLLSFLAWTLNALAALLFKWNQGILMNIYALNIFIFLLFLYGIVKVTK